MKHHRLLLLCCVLGATALSRAQSTLVAPRALPVATETQLRAILADTTLSRAHVGVSIQALGTVADEKAFPAQAYASKAQPVLWQQEADKRFIPASNAKLYTAALALKVLGAKRTFATLVQTYGTRHQSTLMGDVALIGGGDPSLKSEDLKGLAQQLFASGLRRIEGDIIGDGSAFRAETFGGRYPDGWTLDDSLWYYGPEISALAINRNQVDVTIEGTRSGQPARVRVSPAPEGFSIRANVQTITPGPQGTAATRIEWERATGQSAIGPVLTVGGGVQAGETISEGVAVPDPPRWAAQIFKRALQERGIVVSGTARSGVAARPVGTVAVRMARHDSAPLATLLAAFLKPSDNLYGEMLLRATSLFKPPALLGARPGTAATSHSLLFSWLRQSGVEIDGLQFTDGSGLSRYNLITPRATTGLLAAVQTLPDGSAFWDALPIAGVDGTLRRRMKSTAGSRDLAEGNVRAKTGSFSIVSTLSGYVTTQPSASGARHRLAVSILCNFARGDDARRVQNQIFSLLAAMKLGD